MIRPPSDLVMDVVRAADPARAAAVSQRLAQAGEAAGAAATGSFDAQMRLAAARPLVAAAPPAAAKLDSKLDSKAQVGRGLEELMMRNLLEEALPKDAQSVYGSGSAGSIWRSFFAEHLAHALSQSGRVGLAPKLVANAAANAGGKA